MPYSSHSPPSALKVRLSICRSTARGPRPSFRGSPPRRILDGETGARPNSRARPHRARRGLRVTRDLIAAPAKPRFVLTYPIRGQRDTIDGDPAGEDSVEPLRREEHKVEASRPDDMVVAQPDNANSRKRACR